MPITKEDLHYLQTAVNDLETKCLNMTNSVDPSIERIQRLLHKARDFYHDKHEFEFYYGDKS
jgi:hypothetical protein